MIYGRSRKLVLTGIIVGLIGLTLALIYLGNLVVFTISLDTRALNLGVVGEVKAVEPARASSEAEKLISSAIYEGLVTFDQKSNRIKPLLAHSWHYSDNGKCLTVKLQKNLKFSNGKPVTAQSVKASWENNISTASDWYNAGLFLTIAGTKERIDGKTKEISGIQIVDNNTLKIHLLKPDAVFVSMLANPIFWVADASDPSISAGTGPFSLKQFKENGPVLLVRNETYHRDRPYLSAININVYPDADLAYKDYQSGKLDYLNTVPLNQIAAIKKNVNYKSLFISQPLFEIYYLGFNAGRPPYSQDYLLRRALNYAIDRKALNESVFGGAYIPLKTAVPLGIPGGDDHMRGYSYDLKKSRQLLTEAGYPEGEGLPLLTLSYNSDPGHKQVAETIAAQLARVGIEVQTLPMEWTYYKKQLTSMSMSFFRVGWQADYPDADAFLYNLYHSSQIGISNFSGYNNPQVDKLLDSSRAQLKNQEERTKLLTRAQQIIVDDAPCLWLFQRQSTGIISKQVRNLKVNGLNFVDWSKVELMKPK